MAGANLDIGAEMAAAQNLVTVFYQRAAAKGNAPFLWQTKDGSYQPTTWAEARDAVTHLANGLREAGISKGDRVVIVSENRPEWLIADVAIMAAGGVAVPAYTTNTTDDHLHIITNSGAKGVIVSTARLARPLLPAAHTAPSLEFVVAMEAPQVTQDIGVAIHLWDDLIKLGAKRADDVEAEAQSFGRDELCCIIYTSGTGGAPKGVMLSNGAILHNIEGSYDILNDFPLKTEVFLSFLPLSHAYEHLGGLWLPVAMGAEIYYAQSIDALTRNMAEARPTLMTAVPRLYEMVLERVTREITKTGGLTEKLFNRTLEIGRKRYEDPGSLTIGERAIDVILSLLVRRKLQKRFGGRLKAFISGGAALNADVGIFFTALGICILQGYGQTESAPLISANRRYQNKIQTVGLPVKNTEVKIAADGEILVRGELLMMGYWENEEATKETVVDGWLHTGDIGLIDNEGMLQITDRKKDIIVVSGGDTVSPARIEGFLTLEPEIDQAMAYGDGRAHLVALIVPGADFVDDWKQQNDVDENLEELVENPDFRKSISDAVGRVNRNFSNLEKVRKFVLTAELFDTENGQMTPTLKIRRHVISRVYGEALDALYD